ncbi:MAG: hypothetical protein A2271_03560 [Candidatus Moranbacteria bacterium RIFOXYA12_FULL_35_19]|nr:MAG: hypothetical protein A2343_01510 [Candidatus Moranbacteria bacterium RIFOXYB12_FULL_35_8]OGI33390.1 MAG: hypothetical protein A2489_04055 [Candidatus Moranbacteria bacterium RIFOXYC12_FULL_36_13]OGI36260.1 MAG: hypothetical protein A2271_03560 [Candidatus Moranbacteria bacterium RIFOXYA12_FULL_35_19]
MFKNTNFGRCSLRISKEKFMDISRSLYLILQIRQAPIVVPAGFYFTSKYFLNYFYRVPTFVD